MTVLHRLPYSGINFFAYEKVLFALSSGRGVKNRDDQSGTAIVRPQIAPRQRPHPRSIPRQRPYPRQRLSRRPPRRSPSIYLFFSPQVHRLLAGGSAGVIACAATYPLDLVRTRLSTQTTVAVYSGVLGTMRSIVRADGYLGARGRLWHPCGLPLLR